jgi:hypothetical protein
MHGTICGLCLSYMPVYRVPATDYYTARYYEFIYRGIAKRTSFFIWMRTYLKKSTASKPKQFAECTSCFAVGSTGVNLQHGGFLTKILREDAIRLILRVKCQLTLRRPALHLLPLPI